MTETTNCCPPGLSRRTFLRGAAVAAGAMIASPLVSGRVAYAADASYAGDTLVVLSLRGGFDGLSAIAPVGDPAYYAARPTIAVPQALGLQLDSMFALHPSLAPLKPLWDSGVFGAVTAVGHPSKSRSHFTAQEELERAALGTSLRTGWIDRAIGTLPTGTPFQSVALGGKVPQSMAGPTPEIALRTVDSFKYDGGSSMQDRTMAALKAMYQGSGHPFEQAVMNTIASLRTAETLRAVPYVPANGAVYPDTGLGRAFKDVARLITGNVGVQAITLDQGNWDMHNGLGRAGTGWMADNLKQLAGALAAFAQDLGDGLSKVSVVTLTEFGRRVQENGSGGVDHGYGQQVLLLGGGIVGGRVHGRWPGLSDAALDSGDLAGTTDYRNVVGELLVRRMGVGSLSGVFPGLTPSFLGLARR